MGMSQPAYVCMYYTYLRLCRGHALRRLGHARVEVAGAVVVAAASAALAALLVVEVALVPLAVVEVVSVHRLDVLAQRGRVGVALGAAGGAAGVRLLQ